MSNNPWEVESLQAFLFLKCPECTFDTQEEDFFQSHAVGNHPLSVVLFGQILKDEKCDVNYDNGDKIIEYTEITEECDIETPEFEVQNFQDNQGNIDFV